MPKFQQIYLFQGLNNNKNVFYPLIISKTKKYLQLRIYEVYNFTGCSSVFFNKTWRHVKFILLRVSQLLEMPCVAHVPSSFLKILILLN